MWKIVIGFVIFAALAMFVIIQGGEGLDMSGEKHDTSSSHPEPAKK
jgi:preprotein translocase subunit SecG